MKNLFLWIVILISGVLSAQNVSIPSTAKFNNSQKYGLTVKDVEYTLTVDISDSVLKYKTREDQKFTEFQIKKKTDKYIIASANDNYLFYDVKKKQLHVLDYFMSRYIVMSYGEGYGDLKSMNVTIMKKLKEGSTQKDVMAFLASQTEYDF